MLKYIARRILIALPVLLGISLIVFFLVKLQPGDPFAGMVDPSSAPEEKERLLRNVGFYDPIWLQYLRWLGRLLTGDLGYSIVYGEPVLNVIRSRLGNTALLAATAMAVTIACSIPLGLYAGLRRGNRSDLLISVISFLIVSVPTFFLAMVMIKVFAADLKLMPTSGVVTVGANYTGWAYIGDVALHLVMPAIVLALGNIAIMSRYMRASVSELVDQDFIKTLFAKGLGRRQVISPHLLRNAAKPLITIVSLEIPSLFSATLLTETVFNWPGVGRLNYEAAMNRDYALLMGIVLLLAMLIVVVNLVADLLYAVVDPRVRIAR